jgi:hypothetical protein
VFSSELEGFASRQVCVRLKTRRLCGSDVKRLLKVLVQDIEESVCKAPHEEEDGDERHLGALDMVLIWGVLDLRE